MRAVCQRVEAASVAVDGRIMGSIKTGLLVFLGIQAEDNTEDFQWMLNKLPSLRCFEDENGRMNCSVKDVDGDILLISQFTLFGNLRKGSRPSFNRAEEPARAEAFFNEFAEELRRTANLRVPTGVFGANMKIEAFNDGPVTLILDSRDRSF